MTAAFYLYCVVEAGEHDSLGKSGIDNANVLTLPVIPAKDENPSKKAGTTVTMPFRSLAIVGHSVADWNAKNDQEKLLQWAKIHNDVVECAWKKYLTVLPFTFATIIRGDESALLQWVNDNYPRLINAMNKVRDKAEYGVQIFWQSGDFLAELLSSHPELNRLSETVKNSRRGSSYLYQRRLEKLLEEELENKASKLFRQYFDIIKEQVSEISVDKIKPQQDQMQMLLNISVLATKEQSGKLGDVLDNIQNDGFKVRYAGPWPPYSFV